MMRQHVQQIVGNRAATPGAANDVLEADFRWRKDDATLRVKGFAEGEFHSWTDEEIVNPGVVPVMSNYLSC